MVAAVTYSKLQTSLTRCSATTSLTSMQVVPRHTSSPWHLMSQPVATGRLTSHHSIKSYSSMTMPLRPQWASNGLAVVSPTTSMAKMAAISAVVQMTLELTPVASASQRTPKPMNRSTRRGATIGYQGRSMNECEVDGCQGGSSNSRLEGIS